MTAKDIGGDYLGSMHRDETVIFKYCKNGLTPITRKLCAFPSSTGGKPTLI